MARLRQRKKGFTLVEMLVTLTILAILAAAILPLAKTAVKREKEIELRRNVRIIREAIDAYKKLADEKKIEVEEDQEGYPPDLETLVKGVEVKETQQAEPQIGSGLERRPAKVAETEPKVVKFLRRIPLDPMTGTTDWGLRSYQDEPDSDDWGGENVYDIYSKSPGTALDGTKYKDW
jgi:general secretion pathway protein G